MFDPSKISEIEDELAKRGISLSKFCGLAGIAETTFWRWKSGKFDPSFKASKSVTAALKELSIQTEKGAA